MHIGGDAEGSDGVYGTDVNEKPLQFLKTTNHYQLIQLIQLARQFQSTYLKIK